MTHDPLCAKSPTGVHYIGVCTCDLIAKVRADTLSRVMKRVEQVPFIEPKHADWFTHIAGAKPDLVRRDVLMAISTLRVTRR